MTRHLFSLLICPLKKESKQEMISQSTDDIVVKAREEELVIRAIAEIIREKSQAGQFISQDEIFHRLLERGLIKGNKQGAENVLETLLEKSLERKRRCHKTSHRRERTIFLLFQIHERILCKDPDAEEGRSHAAHC